MALSPETPRRVRRNSFCVCAVNAAWFTDKHAQTMYAYARDHGLPIRAIVHPDVQLPEETFFGVADLEIVASRGPAADAEQIRAWVIDSKRACN